MTKAQANAMMNALETSLVPASAVMTFPAPPASSWRVLIDPNAVLSGTQLAQLAAYCSTNSLTMSATFSQLGIT